MQAWPYTQRCHRRVGLPTGWGGGVNGRGAWLFPSHVWKPQEFLRQAPEGHPFKCIHSVKESLQPCPDEELRLRSSGLTGVGGRCPEHWRLRAHSLPCLLLREDRDPFPSQQGLQDPACTEGRPERLFLLWRGLGHPGWLCGAPRSTLSLRVDFALIKGRSGDGSQDDDTRETPGSESRGMARPGQGNPVTVPQGGSCSQAHAWPLESEKLRLGPPEGARGQRGGGAGDPGRAAAEPGPLRGVCG